MPDTPLILIENKIPFIARRLERFANVRYLSPDEFTTENVANADALIIRTRTACNASLLAGSSVKLIVTATIGTDHIDLQWCKNNGITVCNAPGCNAPGVAQYVWSSILNLGINPETATIGIVGCGHVGSIVAEWAEHLGAKTLLCDPPLAATDTTGKYIPLEELLPRCDVVTLHTPLTSSGAYPTFHLIDEPQLRMMRKNAVLINAARGAVISTTAAIKAAENSSIRFVIDCWEGEPEISTDLLQLAEVATPHIAGYSLEGKQRATRMAIEATARFFDFPLDEIDLEDLAATYSPKSSLTVKAILDSYSPLTDTAELCKVFAYRDIRGDRQETRGKKAAKGFEALRGNYHYRPEP